VDGPLSSIYFIHLGVLSENSVFQTLEFILLLSAVYASQSEQFHILCWSNQIETRDRNIREGVDISYLDHTATVIGLLGLLRWLNHEEESDRVCSRDKWEMHAMHFSEILKANAIWER
jgi:hypothetical protein